MPPLLDEFEDAWTDCSFSCASFEVSQDSPDSQDVPPAATRTTLTLLHKASAKRVAVEPNPDYSSTSTYSESDDAPVRPQLKRQKLTIELNEEDQAACEITEAVAASEDLSTEDFGSPWTGPRVRLRSCSVLPSELVYPKSHYEGWTASLPVHPEKAAIYDLLHEWKQLQLSLPEEDRSEYVVFRLSDFSVYGSSTSNSRWDYSFEFVPLQNLKTKGGADKLLFDGVLSVGSVHRYVEKVPFEILAVEGYDELSWHTVEGKIFFQSHKGRIESIWYRLAEPAHEYRRYFEPYFWIANLAKHFLDYLFAEPDLTLNHFCTQFYDWLVLQHGDDESFNQWLARYAKTDFRAAIVANVLYLKKEFWSIAECPQRYEIWNEIDHQNLKAITEERLKETTTIVTPYVNDCFAGMYFAKCLKPCFSLDSKVTAAREARLKALGFSFNEDPRSISRTEGVQIYRRKHLSRQPSSSEDPLHLPRPLRVLKGEVVGVNRDKLSSWKDQESIWYAYVQDVRLNKKGKEVLDVVWLYRPADTTLGKERYPFDKELFFSDHCACGRKALPVSEVVCKINVEWFPRNGKSRADYFVRQKYRTDKELGAFDFVSLKNTDFTCECESVQKSALEAVMEKFIKGDTVLVVQRKGATSELEPVVIVDFVLEKEQVVVRRLKRAARDLKDERAWPNELVWTNQTYSIHATDVERKCHVRFYSKEDVARRRIPAPYERDGQVDCFYITSWLVHRKNKIEHKELSGPFPASLNQGFDPTRPPPRKPLKGIALYCGGGNFDRGLEEGGAVKIHYAVDWNKDAIHSYRANIAEPDKVHLFHGSVNDYLSQAIQGSNRPEIATIGDVEFVSAGNPCTGFSSLQPDKQSTKSLRDASMVASVASFIDFYRPQYAVMENVPQMTAPVDKGKQNVFSRLLCALVGMGYQVQQFNLDAWSFGSAQSRSRLFIAIAAPGLKPLPHPVLTHAHPPGTGRRCLGRAVNGVPFGTRRVEPTAFTFVTASEATADLPHITDSHVQTCISSPDHRTSRDPERWLTRNLIAMVPRYPLKQNFVRAVQRGYMAQPQREMHDWRNPFQRDPNMRSWSRANPHGLFQTISTACRPRDAFHGRVLHWEEHRLLTIMEARRAQGFLDHEVIVGLPSSRWRIVGNSVARPVALGLGMSIREAWLGNAPDDRGSKRAEPRVVVEVRDASTEVELALEAGSRSDAPSPYQALPKDVYAVKLPIKRLHRGA